LRHFFPSRVSSINGNVSSTEVKERIKEIIGTENPQKPFCDEDIREILLKKGINISRRTVQKYREEIGIPSSSLRRKI